MSLESFQPVTTEEFVDEETLRMRSLIGRRMAAVALDNVTDDESSYDDARLFDLATL